MPPKKLNTKIRPSEIEYESDFGSLSQCNYCLFDQCYLTNATSNATDHSMLYIVTQSTFNSKETIHWCLLTLIILTNYLISNVHDD